MKSWMVKHVSNKGFTLIEMMLILMVLSMLIIIVPVVRPQKTIQLQYEMQTMKQILMETQMTAWISHTNQQVKIHTSSISYLGKTHQLANGIQCEPAIVKYYDNGNIAQAKTIRCSCDGASRRIILELGSGSIYVR